VTSGGCEVDVEGAGPHSRFCWSSISSLSSWLGLSASLLVETLVAVDNSAQPCLNLWLALPSLCPLDVAHVMNASRLSPFLPLFHFCVLLSMQTEEQEQGRPGNEARGTALTNYFLTGVVLRHVWLDSPFLVSHTSAGNIWTMASKVSLKWLLLSWLLHK